MAKRIMLAVAGAGKTYRICNELNPQSKNLILAFTHANVDNIVRELVKKHGEVPFLTEVMTFHSFVYRYGILPFQPTILAHFQGNQIRPNGISLADPPPQRIKIGSRTVPNRQYKKKDNFEHYVTKSGQYYCERLTELIMEVKANKQSLWKKIAAATNRFYDMVFVDEFQDFREYDYEFMVSLSKLLDNVLLVGDYYQHSVSGKNNSGKPFSKKSTPITYQEFLTQLEHSGFTVDTATLRQSRRCSPEICKLIVDKLDIEIESVGCSTGVIKWIPSEQLPSILDDDSIVKLVQQEARRYSFNARNWSYSKGDTYSAVCVILTKALNDFEQSGFRADPTKPKARNSLYVALSRSSGDLLLVRDKDFQLVKDKYFK